MTHYLLEQSILETKAQIAEKERISNVASSEMSDEDLRLHFASLKRLRGSLAAMQYKLDRLGADESEKAEAKQKLPEVHGRWAAMPLESKQRFIRAATSRITLDELATGWLKLTIEWSALLGDDVIDEAYIWTTGGKRWTEEEKHLLRAHYKTADRQWILEQLPDRGWDSIIAQASKLGLGRKYPPRSIVNSPADTVAASIFSSRDWQFMETNEIPVEIILATRIYWREYVSLPIEANHDVTSRYDPLPQCVTLSNLSGYYELIEEYEQAKAYNREAIQLARQLGHREWLCQSLLNQAGLAIRANDSVQAEAIAQEALALAIQIEKTIYICNAYRLLGHIALILKTVYTRAGVELTDPQEGCKLVDIKHKKIPRRNSHAQESDREYNTRCPCAREVRARDCSRVEHLADDGAPTARYGH